MSEEGYSDDNGKGIHVEGAHFSTNEEIDAAVEALAKTGFRVFIGIFYTSDYERVMESAYRNGIAGVSHHLFLFVLSTFDHS